VIHANKAQSARRLALSQFKSGQSRILVATDIVSRGIDIVELSHVFNFNLPEAPEDYVHRIGRTGRAGLGGKAISFCDNSEIKYLETIEKHIGKKITVIEGHPYPLQYAPEELVSKKPEQSNFMNRRPRSPGNSVGQKPRERKQTEYGQRKQQKKR
jgi:ATP-dependent RNA helicase RhlE